jgi:predicted metal-dependent phosphoesterase TrpH
MKKRYLLSLFLVMLFGITYSQKPRNLQIPDIPGFYTLKGDFHQHTVFSDGQVWPTVRIDEAVREGLDVIAITDHIEYRPHKQDLPGDLNRSYDIEKPYADKKNILLVKGIEITRGMPPGHFNALFIKDANPLAKEDFKDAVLEAKKQGAFILWNHPGWKAQQPDTTRWLDIHTWLYENGLMNGIEIYNDKEYYSIAFDWGIQKNLTLFANTDTHEPTSMSYDLINSHRPLTLVFAKDKTLDAVKDALFKGQTATYTGNMIRGREEWIKPLFNACVNISRNGRKITVSNKSGLVFDLEDNSGTLQHLDQNGSAHFESANPVTVRVKNFETAPGKNLIIVLK